MVVIMLLACIDVASALWSSKKPSKSDFKLKKSESTSSSYAPSPEPDQDHPRTFDARSTNFEVQLKNAKDNGWAQSDEEEKATPSEVFLQILQGVAERLDGDSANALAESAEKMKFPTHAKVIRDFAAGNYR